MTDEPINLDGRRTEADQRQTEMRRRPANSESPSTGSGQPHVEGLEDQMLAEPAGTWVEVMEKWRFLLLQYSATTEAGDDRIQELIRRAIGDMERLRKRKERK